MNNYMIYTYLGSYECKTCIKEILLIRWGIKDGLNKLWKND